MFHEEGNALHVFVRLQGYTRNPEFNHSFYLFTRKQSQVSLKSSSSDCSKTDFILLCT